MKVAVLVRELEGAGNALEQALRLKEKNLQGNENTWEIICICMAEGERCQETISQAFALGVDRCIWIYDKQIAGADSAVTAQIIGKTIEKLGTIDLILAGNRGFPGTTGNVGPMVAEYLGISGSGNVDAFEYREGRLILWERLYEDCRVMSVPTPSLLVINSGKNQLRGMTLAGIQRGCNKEPEKLSLKDLELEPRKVTPFVEILAAEQFSVVRQHRGERIEYNQEVKESIEELGKMTREIQKIWYHTKDNR